VHAGHGSVVELVPCVVVDIAFHREVLGEDHVVPVQLDMPVSDLGIP
jgi:hypothetical protein